ncbi:MAG: S41 family peptidase, partial [Pseudomonadota bacterium]
MKTSLMTAAVSALTVVGCAQPQTDALAFAPDVQGAWLTDGYGNLLVIRPDAVDLYDYLPGLCVPVGGTDDDPDLAALVREIGIRQQDGALEIRLPFESHMRRAERLPGLPEACSNEPDASPAGVVEAAIQFFEAHYTFKELHGVDWPTRKRRARAGLRSDMGDEDLFALLTEMLSDIPDGHLGLTDDVGFVTRGFSPNSGPTMEVLFPTDVSEGERERIGDRFLGAYWTETVPEQVLGGQGTRVANDRIQYGVLDGDIGYLAVLTMGGYTEEETVGAELAALDAALDEALTAFEAAGVSAVLVDLSVNLGGYDQVATAIAARFATEPTVAYTKWAADAEMPVRTEKVLAPAGDVRFSGPMH